jgi:hypothetical protein
VRVPAVPVQLQSMNGSLSQCPYLRLAVRSHLLQNPSYAKHALPPWLKPKTPPAQVGVGVTWYTEAQWALVRAAAVDPDRFERTFEAWEKMAEASLVKFRAAGIVPTKVYINSNDLLAWCLARQKVNNAAARAQFVSEQGAKRHEDGI